MKTLLFAVTATIFNNCFPSLVLVLTVQVSTLVGKALLSLVVVVVLYCYTYNY